MSMNWFKRVKPRAFEHRYLYYNERKENIDKLKEKYEEEGNIKAANRIDKIVKDYEFKFDKIAKVKAGERV